LFYISTSLILFSHISTIFPYPTLFRSLFVKQVNTPPYSLSIDFSQKGKKLYSKSFTYLSCKFFPITISPFIYFILACKEKSTVPLTASFSLLLFNFLIYTHD